MIGDDDDGDGVGACIVPIAAISAGMPNAINMVTTSMRTMGLINVFKGLNFGNSLKYRGLVTA